ncbi:hypothetical protein [Pseudomonas aeruginosa]|uniref:hypothetical protein n=1 Tax=Pseudomonas aeruginosa TaxID=287 RepID=UPI001CD7CE36|nr:hypothetical protein [Pseudomonas aeruginosa]
MSIGVLDPTDVTYAVAQGAQLRAGVVATSDTAIRNSAVAREQLANLPQRFAQPDLVLWSVAASRWSTSSRPMVPPWLSVCAARYTDPANWKMSARLWRSPWIASRMAWRRAATGECANDN